MEERERKEIRRWRGERERDRGAEIRRWRRERGAEIRRWRRERGAEIRRWRRERGMR